MAILQMIFLMLCGSSFFAVIFNRKIEETIIFDIMSSIVLVYIFGLFGHLALGVYAFITFSILLLIVEIIVFIRSKNKKQIIKNILTPGLLIFLALNVLIMYFERGRMFVQWDEFSHWGSAVKSMFMINDFSTNPNSTLMFQSYPPAMTIFQYMFCFIKGQFIEYYTFYAYSIFCVSLFLPFTAKINWKDKYKIILYLVLIVLTPVFIFNNFYSTIYIDAALGLTFGFIISKIITKKEKYTIYDIVLICLSLFILILQKDTGMFLAIIAVIALVCRVFDFDNKYQIKDKFKVIFAKKNFKKILIIVLSILTIVLAKTSWNYSIKHNNAEVMFSGKYDVKGILNIIIGKDTTYRMEVCNKFVNECINNNKIFEHIVSLSTFELGIVFIIAFLIISKSCKYSKRENRILVILIIGLFIYLFGLMITYAYKFSEVEALGLASFDRYVKIYFAGMAGILTSLIMNDISIGNKTLCIIVAVILLFSPNHTIINLHKSSLETVNARGSYLEETNKIQHIIGNSKKIFYIDKGNPDLGYTYWVNRYSLIPVKFNGFLTFNTTAKTENLNKYTYYLSLQELKDLIYNEEYEYVYVKNIDENFVNEYGEMFENITPQSLYKVQDNNLIKIY